ncbi:tetratricopeptide repeat protein 25 isoform X2 [Aplysia californica]|uniref:Outer dynein arm-docking complex subunit 4 n=1 Tax=Aplysia californica TaxID=6500 RepID=A0ABM1A2G5_APLCA|nr:tetratricopeptide repeat protein 25 isoform X2 [Aplysia californica]
MPKGRGRKDSDSDAATDDQGTVGTFETLRDEGEHFVHVQQYVKAIESFSKALEMKPEDKTCLVVRAKCHLMLGNSEKALEDANTALDQDEDGKRDIRALNMKAEALYQKGDFETALVFYHRGNKLRPELQEFRLGIQKCQEAIDNSIGSPSSVHLEASGDLSYFYKDEEDQKLKKQKQQQKGYTKVSQAQKKEERKERQKPQDGSNTKTTKELLGQLYRDKEYLEKLFDSLSHSSTQTDSYIKGRACDGLEYLTVRSDFWRQQKPMYARKRDRQARSAHSAGPRDPMKYVLQKLVEIDEAQAEGKYEESLEKSKKTLKRVEETSEDSLKNKPDVMANLYSCMGNAYLEMNMYADALSCHKKDLSIAKDNNLEEAESRALDNLGRTCAKMGDFGEAIEIWKKKLPKSKSPLESTWLYHEIGRCHLELGEYQDAKDYGEKSLAAAKEADDAGWQLHACVLIAQSEVKCGELEAASETFTRALELAEDQEDRSAESAIKKALEEVNDRLVKGGQEDDEQDKEDDRRSPDRDRESPAPKGSDKDKDGKKSSPRADSPKDEKTYEDDFDAESVVDEELEENSKGKDKKAESGEEEYDNDKEKPSAENEEQQVEEKENPVAKNEEPTVDDTEEAETAVERENEDKEKTESDENETEKNESHA